jgi:hypothetical protein
MNEKQKTNQIDGNIEGNFIGGDAKNNTLSYIKNQGVVPSQSEQIQVKESLTKLRDAIEADSNLNLEQKKKVLEQVKIIEEAVESPQEGEKKKQAQKAAEYLKITLDILSPAAKFVEECNKLLPLIAKFLGLASLI